jgi:hypothetical protein
MNMWERLPAAIETNPSDVGYFVNSLVIRRYSELTVCYLIKFIALDFENGVMIIQYRSYVTTLKRDC